MKLYAISDLHVGHKANREALLGVAPHPEDWLIVAGDVGETEAHVELAISTFAKRFAKVIWTPGNHELWTFDGEPRGVDKYERLVAICRRFGALTPEDPFARFYGRGGPFTIAPIFTLYDYSFRPDDVPAHRAVAWAEESGVLCTDELFLAPDPYPSRAAWCEARVAYTERRLAEVAGDKLVIAGHFPLTERLVRFEMVPRFSIWCGTRRTEDWHVRFGASVVVYGHLHKRGTDIFEGVRFEEVSFGYPRDWRDEAAARWGMNGFLREIA